MKNVKIDLVYFKEQVHIRKGHQTRPERMLSSARYELSMEGVGWLLVVAPGGHRTYVPVNMISSMVELNDETEK